MPKQENELHMDYNLIPDVYYKILNILDNLKESRETNLKNIIENIKKDHLMLKNDSIILSEAVDAFMQEVVQTTKIKEKKLLSIEASDDLHDEFVGQRQNFAVLVGDNIFRISKCYEDFYNIVKKLNKPNVYASKRKLDYDDYQSFQQSVQEMNFNKTSIVNYVHNIAVIYTNSNWPKRLAQDTYKSLENYYQLLTHRHSVEGIKIFKNAAITDVAIKIFENVDSHGGVTKEGDKMSAYTLRKAQTLAKALKTETLQHFIKNPDLFIEYLQHWLKSFMSHYETVFKLIDDEAQKLETALGNDFIIKDNKLVSNYVNMLEDINPSNIVYVASTKIVDENEKMIRQIKEETLENVTSMLVDENVEYSQLVEYIISRKAELKKFFHEENSFYTCKIGGGNVFSGQAPGELYLVPSPRPKSNMNNILGSGFDEVREFAESVVSSAKFHNLFLASSPSNNADKSNVLMIAPPGAGKSEVMSAIGSDKGSIGVFAQGSDFLTCWSGMSQGNPKRMFEESLKLNQESGKHVNILLDEIDAVLNDDQKSTTTNLTLEFQILMDGVVNYPNLSIWGATNHPGRIPMAMLRRFNKVLIVGELNQEDRVKLLKMFCGKMPLTDISDIQWEDWAQALEGATGDVIRKVADNLWRKHMNLFVKKYPIKAEELSKLITEKYGDNFDIDKLDRIWFKKHLGKHLKINVTEISKAVEETLNNVTIKEEIRTAIRTYAEAKDLLSSIND